MYQSPCRLFLGYTILTTALLDVTVLIYVVRLDSNWSFGLAKHGNTSLTASQLVTRKTFWTSFYIDLLFFCRVQQAGRTHLGRSVPFLVFTMDTEAVSALTSSETIYTHMLSARHVFPMILEKLSKSASQRLSSVGLRNSPRPKPPMAAPWS